MSAEKLQLKRFATHYWVWRLYHLLVADAIAIQRPTKYKVVRKFLGRELGIAADVGCGPGVFTRYLGARAIKLFEIDIDYNSLQRVKARHRRMHNSAFVLATADCLPLPSEGLDTLLFLEVLEHLVDDTAAVRELWRVLRPGGRLVLSVPVPPGEVNEDSSWGHKREGYERNQIISLLESNGFEVIEFAFAEFKFARHAAQLVRWWRQNTKLPAPIFLSWVAYLDHLLNSRKSQTGSHLPASIVILALRSSPR